MRAPKPAVATSIGLSGGSRRKIGIISRGCSPVGPESPDRLWAKLKDDGRPTVRQVQLSLDHLAWLRSFSVRHDIFASVTAATRDRFATEAQRALRLCPGPVIVIEDARSGARQARGIRRWHNSANSPRENCSRSFLAWSSCGRSRATFCISVFCFVGMAKVCRGRNRLELNDAPRHDRVPSRYSAHDRCL